MLNIAVFFPKETDPLQLTQIVHVLKNLILQQKA